MPKIKTKYSKQSEENKIIYTETIIQMMNKLSSETMKAKKQ